MPQNQQKVAKRILESVGGKPKVIEFNDLNNISTIDIFIGLDRPYEGVTTYSTIGLSEYTVGLELEGNKELRVEFIGASENNFDKFANIVSSCAFNIINNNFGCKPGVVYPNVIHEYYGDSEMKHVLITNPFLWENLNNIETTNKVITWLMLVPISDKEFEFLRRNGSDKLEDIFESKNIDIFDIYRKSIL